MRNTDGCTQTILLNSLAFFAFVGEAKFFLAKREFNEIIHVHLCAAIRISHKQFLAKNSAAVESGPLDGCSS